MARESISRNVFFVGFMGAGKSTVARRLARSCGVASLDMDKYIERAQGLKISEIFAKGGEGLFREIERQTLMELAASDSPMLISCGGGIVVSPENRQILKESGFVVHLLVDADEAASRISDKSSRPLFNDIESARARCRDRLPLYEEVADMTIATGGKDVYGIANEVVGGLRKAGVLCRQRG